MENGFGYTPIEAELVNTPVIITPCDSFLEIGLNDKNALITDWNLDNIDVDLIYKKALKPIFTQPKSTWNEILYKGKDNYDKNAKVSMISTRFYTDTYFNKDIDCGTEIEVSEKRALELIKAGVAEYA